MKFFRVKELSDVRAEASKTELKKTMTSLDLLLLGLGGIIGSGIFVITGYAAANYAGPAITVSFLLGAFACTFTALAYSELAAMLPVAGSAYTYAYVTMGEGFAALVGWAIVMVSVFGAATVGAGWSGYATGILSAAGIPLPEVLTKIPSQGGWMNFPAFLIVAIMSMILVRGTQGVSKLNGLLVMVKIAAIFLFVLISIPHIDPVHWESFAPNGFIGIAAGAGFIFMAYTGFDTVATAAEECKNPNRDLPIGIIGSLVGSALLYIIVSGVLTSIAPYSSLNNSEPMAHALRYNGIMMGAKIVALGALTGLSTVILAQVYGLSRILFVMARDGILPSCLMKIHPKFSTPYVGILGGGALIAVIAGFLPVATLGQLCSMFTLMVFIFVSIGVMILRYKKPDEKRTFRCPAVYFIASTSVIFCSFLFVQLFLENWKLYLLSVFGGLLIYALYGSRYSTMNEKVAVKVLT
jgi:basic amino acid/polyamine antiporter, APA family